MTQKEGKELRASLEAQGERIALLESGVRDEREQLRAAVEQAQAKVAELEGVLEQATEVVTRNSADMGVEVQGLKDQQASLEGKLDELTHETQQLRSALDEQRTALEQRVESFARRAGVDMPLDERDIPQDRDAHYNAAKMAFDKGEHSKARGLLREFLQRYPRDAHADDAQYMLGGSYLRQNRPATALGELRKVLTEYGDGDAIDETLYDMADAFYQLNSCKDAKAALQALIEGHPRSPLVRKARTKMGEIRRAPRDYCRD